MCKGSPDAFDLFRASWDREGSWPNLLRSAVRRIWPALGVGSLDAGGPTLEAVGRHSKALLAACKRVSRFGTMLQALHGIVAAFREGPVGRIVGPAVPMLCPDCGVTPSMPSPHMLIGFMGRLLSLPNIPI